MSFFRELQKRNVIKIGVAYVVVAWLLTQVAVAILPTFEAPQWVLQTVIFLLILGFPLALVLAWAFELTGEGIRWADQWKSGRRDSHEADTAPGDGDRARIAVQANRGVSSRTALPGARTERLPNSVAVLPFANLNPNDAENYFAAGLHDEILNQLTKNRSLNVIARTSVLQYAGAQSSIQEIARELNVEKVMEGSVRFSGDRVRVTAQLIDAESGKHLWSETYERKFDDIFGIESDVAISVADAMQAAFSPEERRRIERVHTQSPAAYSLYLRAREIFSTGGGKPEQAHDFLERAIEIDPQFARAYGLNAMLYALSFINTDQHAGEGAMSQARLEEQIRLWAGKAIAIDPRNEEARAAIRIKSVETWHWSEFDRAMEPGDETRLEYIGLWLYAWRGQVDYAVRLAERIVELNPNDPSAYLALGVLYSYAGKHSASNRMFQRALKTIPDSVFVHAWLAFNAIATGQRDRALEFLRLEEKLLGDNREIVYLPDLAYCYARIGKTDDVDRVLQEIHALGEQMELGAGTWAIAYLASGNEEKCLEQLELVAQKARNHAPDHGFYNVMSFRMNHLADPTLEKPEFVDVFSRITGD